MKESADIDNLPPFITKRDYEAIEEYNSQQKVVNTEAFLNALLQDAREDIRSVEHLVRGTMATPEDAAKVLATANRYGAALSPEEAVFRAGKAARKKYLVDLGARRDLELQQRELDPPNSAECLCISIDIRDKETDNLENGGLATTFGVDTIRLFCEEFTIVDGADLTVQPGQLDIATGEQIERALYVTPEGFIVEGEKAFLNTEAYQLTVLSPEALMLQSSIPKVLRPDNKTEAQTTGELMRALAKIEKQLVRRGVSVDLHKATVSRVDISATATLPRTLPHYEPALRSLSYPRMERVRYGGTGFLWKNGEQEICLYDKAKEQGMTEGAKPSKLARAEYRLLRGRAVQSTLNSKSVTPTTLMENPELLRDAYATAMHKLISTDTGSSVDVEGTGRVEAFDAVIEELADERGAETKGLIAMAIASLSATEIELITQSVGEHRGRKAKYRFKKKVEEYSGLSDAFQSKQNKKQRACRELKDAFLGRGVEQ